MLGLTLVRERKGWSKSELSRKSGVGLPEISRIEAQKLFAYPGWRRKISAALNVPEEKLFAEVGELGDTANIKIS